MGKILSLLAATVLVAVMPLAVTADDGGEQKQASSTASQNAKGRLAIFSATLDHSQPIPGSKYLLDVTPEQEKFYEDIVNSRFPSADDIEKMTPAQLEGLRRALMARIVIYEYMSTKYKTRENKMFDQSDADATNFEGYGEYKENFGRKGQNGVGF